MAFVCNDSAGGSAFCVFSGIAYAAFVCSGPSATSTFAFPFPSLLSAELVVEACTATSA